MATNLKSKTLFLALGMIFLLVPITSMTAEAVGPEPEEGNGPVKVFLTGGGCQNCLPAGRPTCRNPYPCEMPMNATIQNLNDHCNVTVQVTLSLTFPGLEGELQGCKHVNRVQVVYVDLGPNTQTDVDFFQVVQGPVWGAVFSVSTVIIAADDPELIGKADADTIQVRSFWKYCTY